MSSSKKELANKSYWSEDDKGWTCRICPAFHTSAKRRAIAHESSKLHQANIHLEELSDIFSSANNPRYNVGEDPLASNEDPDNIPTGNINLIRAILSNMNTGPANDGATCTFAQEDSEVSALLDNTHDSVNETLPSPVQFDTEGLDETFFENQIPLTGSEMVSRALENFREHVANLYSEDEAEEGGERSEDEDSDGVQEIEHRDEVPLLETGTKRMRRDVGSYSRGWYPWPDRLSCTLDILMHLPRSAFSEKQLDIFLWLLKINGVDEVPSVRSTKSLNDLIQSLCGIDSIKFKGSLGHTYYVNNLKQIISQEFANPHVRKNIHVYPRETGGVVQDAREADRWLHEVDGSFLTPMARVEGKDFFIYEPAMLSNQKLCMPCRWFTRPNPDTSIDDMFAKVWPMESDGSTWRVLVHGEFIAKATDFHSPFPALLSFFEELHMLDPRKISGIVYQPGGTVFAWDKTDPKVGNKWRARAKGARVYSFPIWLYCDDTSGNASKKWNKHNSFLFTAAGLPREEAHKEYNVHFLSTSNLAPPLEMLEGIVDLLDECHEEGLWTYDCKYGERALVLPWVLGLLGDNPMQSELASHMGMRAKFFCRMCMVSTSDDTGGGWDGNETASASSDGEGGNNVEGSGGPDEARSRRSRTARTESYQQMLKRVKDFMKIGTIRLKYNTQQKLKEIFETASKVGGKTQSSHLKTESGVKDNILEYYMGKMFLSYQNIRGKEAQQEALDAYLEPLPEDLFSPVWRLHELDPHSSTPVEILHVILLGFIKYLWRDAIHLQFKSDVRVRSKIEHRLSSLDVAGLGIPKISGHTFVQYAGSLTGRDFRVISQVAPFVLYDLVVPSCMRAWVAISKLVPLVWQPKIENIGAHVQLLKEEIANFLHAIACWTPRWFNKPKFHVFLHLPDHVRRFGPPILFATEAFESFNAVIRAKSIHSNRQAPSRDIAHQFAQANRVRHLLSGARMPVRRTEEEVSLVVADSDTVDAQEAGLWRVVGKGAMTIIAHSPIVRRYLGMDEKTPTYTNRVSEASPATRFLNTLLGECSNTNASIMNGSAIFISHQNIVLLNRDTCSVGEWVLYREKHSPRPKIGKLQEILQRRGSECHMKGQADYIILRIGNVGPSAFPYSMPSVQLTNEHLVVPVEDILCTVNVQHNCYGHKCGLSGSRRILEEREDSGRTAPIVKHVNDTDLVLNTAQMRDALYVQKLRVPLQHERSAQREADLQKSVEREVGIRLQIAKAKAIEQRRKGSQTPSGSNNMTAAATPTLPNARVRDLSSGSTT